MTGENWFIEFVVLHPSSQNPIEKNFYSEMFSHHCVISQKGNKNHTFTTFALQIK